MKRYALAVLASTLLAGPALADDAHHKAGTLSDGEIRKVDKDAQKVTIKHGPLKNLDMPPMTMVFRVKDAAMLDGVKQGDQVQFVAENVGGQFVVIRIQPAN